jgi:hypothetical protein
VTRRNPHQRPDDVPLPFADPEPPGGARVSKFAPKPTGKYARKLDPDTDPAAAPGVIEAEASPAPARPAKPPGKPGPAPDPEALSAQLADGRGSHLHVVIPADLHRCMKVRGVMTGRTVSALVAEALVAYLDTSKAEG